VNINVSECLRKYFYDFDSFLYWSNFCPVVADWSSSGPNLAGRPWQWGRDGLNFRETSRDKVDLISRVVSQLPDIDLLFFVKSSLPYEWIFSLHHLWLLGEILLNIAPETTCQKLRSLFMKEIVFI